MPELKLSDSLLVSCGFTALTQEQAEEVLRDLYDTLELRVGKRLSRKLNEAQIASFDKLDLADDNSVGRWMATSLGDYRQEVAEELDEIIAHLREAAQSVTRPDVSE